MPSFTFFAQVVLGECCQEIFLHGKQSIAIFGGGD
jgi:hypothetical protein